MQVLATEAKLWLGDREGTYKVRQQLLYAGSLEETRMASQLLEARPETNGQTFD